MKFTTAFILGACAGTADAVNPIRKVVTMLQNVQKKVEAEGKHEEDLFNKFMCYCKTAGGDLQASISAAEAKIPELESGIKEDIAQEAQLKEDLATHQADREAAKTAMAEATGIREKEAAAYAKLKADAGSDVAAMTKAIDALEKGAGGAFLQTGAADVVRGAIRKSNDLDDDDRQLVMAFLSSSQDSESSAIGQILGILKTQLDEMNAAFAEATSKEQAAIKGFNELIASKKKEVAACTKAIEAKTVRVGELAVGIAEQKNALEDTQEALADDQKFIGDLEKNCKTKQAEWDEIVKTRADEQVALADTIKMLNSDDALELFKKALPAPASSFAQLQATAASTRARALSVIRAAQQKHAGTHLDFIALALHGKKVGFEKVIKMVDDMVTLLKTEQADDDQKKEYCAAEADKLDDKKKGLEKTISDAEAAIEDAKESIKSLTDEIAALNAGIKALDKSVAEATEQRKDENEDFTALMAQDTAAKELLGMAKNRLNKFYNPKMYVAPKEGSAFAEITLHDQQKAAPPPPPEAPGAYSKKSEESNGVIAMMDELVRDLDKEMTVAEAEEKDAQADYETMMAESAEKRKADSKLAADKNSAKADTQAALETLATDKKSASAELAATLKAIQALGGECDWLLKYFDVRKEARTSEIDALGKAKAVLSGADYSLLQTKRQQVQWKPDPTDPFNLFKHPQGSGLVMPCPKEDQLLPEACAAQFAGKADGEQCPQLDCPDALGKKMKLVCGKAGGCCPVCWAPDHIVGLDRHTSENTGLVVPAAPQAPSSCGGVKCFEPICMEGMQKGHVSGSCCYSCTAR